MARERPPIRANGGDKRDLLQSVQRACAVMRLLAREQRPMAPREISEALGLNLATCYHLVNTLAHEGFLVRDLTRRYWLGFRVGELHEALTMQLAPDERLLEALDALNRETGETTYLGIWRGGEAVSAAVREGRRGVCVRGSHLGYAEHTYARALGRALLAFRDPAETAAYLDRTDLTALTESTVTDREQLERILEDVRTLGVAVEREEFIPGVCCAAVPVLDAEGRVVAALSVSVPKARFDAEGQLIVDAVRSVGRAAGEALLDRSVSQLAG